MQQRRSGSPHAEGEKQNQLFQLSFNASLKIDFQGLRVTSDGGLVLVRELDERLGFGELIAQQGHLAGTGTHKSDSNMRSRGTQVYNPGMARIRKSRFNRIVTDFLEQVDRQEK